VSLDVARILRDARRYGRRNVEREMSDEQWWGEHGFIVVDDLSGEQIAHVSCATAPGTMDQHEMERMRRFDAAQRRAARGAECPSRSSRGRLTRTS
jgi:hypothetical protein